MTELAAKTDSQTAAPLPHLRANVGQLIAALSALYRCGQKQGWQTAYEAEMEMARAALANAEDRE